MNATNRESGGIGWIVLLVVLHIIFNTIPGHPGLPAETASDFKRQALWLQNLGAVPGCPVPVIGPNR
jgi:hypothetical protein